MAKSKRKPGRTGLSTVVGISLLLFLLGVFAYILTTLTASADAMKEQLVVDILFREEAREIDILKMDIEGAAFDVLHNILDEKILPNQIAVEFEFSEMKFDEFDEDDFNIWAKKLKDLILKFRLNDYKCYNLPRYSHFPYSTTEVLFVKKSS